MLSNRDKQLKAERGYHGKSYVRPDGSEVLLDRGDWELRKRELWARANGHCEYKENIGGATVQCQQEGWIPAHVIPRHPVRDDRLNNLKLYCGFHDKLMEKQAWRVTRFGEKGKPICKRRESTRLGGKS